MIPSINPSDSPPFHKLNEYTFQKLCCELHARQPGIASCDVYGTRGQRQRGIDLLAHRRGSMEKEVGQCKRYDDFPPAEIRKASEEFLEHPGEDAVQALRFAAICVNPSTPVQGCTSAISLA
jgi:Restriction endonuclease